MEAPKGKAGIHLGRILGTGGGVRIVVDTENLACRLSPVSSSFRPPRRVVRRRSRLIFWEVFLFFSIKGPGLATYLQGITLGR